jgi:hypothetical protein
MKLPKRRKTIARLLSDPELPHHQIVKIPAVLYFPADVLEQLNEFCSLRQLTPAQLMAEAFKRQESRWEQFVDEVMTPLEPGESEAWPEDPLYCLACVATIHFTRTFVKMIEDPIGFEQMKKDAPADWSFGAYEAADPADWWKEEE